MYVSKDNKKIIDYWKKWYMLHGQSCPHPMQLDSMVEMYSSSVVNSIKIWEWDTISIKEGTYRIKFTEHFLKLLND